MESIFNAEPTYFLDRQADIFYGDKKIGVRNDFNYWFFVITIEIHNKNDVFLQNLGTLHPDVVKAFEWKYPISVLELNLEPIILDAWWFNIHI